LQSHKALQAQLCFGVGEAEAMPDFLAVGVANHVISEDDAAHARQHGAGCLEGIATACQRAFAAASDVLFGRCLAGIIHPAVIPVAMGKQDSRQFASLAAGPVQVAADVVARVTGEEDFFNRVFVALDLAVNDSAERRFFRPRPEAVGDQNLLAQLLSTALPFLARFRGLEWEVIVERLGFRVTPVAGLKFAFLLRAKNVSWRASLEPLSVQALPSVRHGKAAVNDKPCQLSVRGLASTS
jgi:hypothetical protein